MHVKNLPQLIGLLFITQLTGLIGSLFTRPGLQDWYTHLTKPFFTPPDWLFGPVWVTLFTLMAIAIHRVIQNGEKAPAANIAVDLFFVHLILNVLWSYLFFKVHAIFYALLDVITIWIIVAVLIEKFKKIDLLAARLMLPYLVWLTFAVILNFYLWQFN